MRERLFGIKPLRSVPPPLPPSKPPLACSIRVRAYRHTFHERCLLQSRKLNNRSLRGPAVSVSVLDLDEIDVERERFASTLRIFAMWTVDLAPLDMPELEERVARSGPLHPGG